MPSRYRARTSSKQKARGTAKRIWVTRAGLSRIANLDNQLLASTKAIVTIQSQMVPHGKGFRPRRTIQVCIDTRPDVVVFEKRLSEGQYGELIKLDSSIKKLRADKTKSKTVYKLKHLISVNLAWIGNDDGPDEPPSFDPFPE